jgi:hypothetical protein
MLSFIFSFLIQFVAMTHGLGYTVEEQVAEEAEHGDFQFYIFPRCQELPPLQDFYHFNMDYEGMQDRF